MKYKFLLANVFSVVLFVFLCGCKQDVAITAEERKPTVLSAATTAQTTCDYNLDETTLTRAGWTKTFDDDFTTDLSKWNIWTGGAYNNELQYYGAGNLQVTNGNLIITPKKETVTGATTASDPTSKTFN